MPMMRVELLVVGNEILSGQTLDTNSQWMARRLVAMGAQVTRRTTIPDTPEDIHDTVAGVLARKPDCLITTGGLGPTFDDMTVQEVAHALGLQLTERQDALDFVQRRYKELYDAGNIDSPELLPGRRKMAMVPAHCELILNTVGTAPGVLVEHGGILIVCLPGVPREMHAMFDEPNVQAALQERSGDHVIRETEILTPYNDESVLGPLCDTVMAQVPGTYLKSRASNFDLTTEIPVLITCTGTDPAEVEARLAKARRLLAEACGISPETAG